MNWNDLERHFSPARLGRYKTAFGGDIAAAAMAYQHNLLLAEAMVPMLNVLEIALRNGIHAALTVQYGRTDWWESWTGNPAFKWQLGQIAEAKGKLARRHEVETADKVIAELTFAFWSSLFNKAFHITLWRSLHKLFRHCPRHQRQRKTISGALNQIRDLRNRIFHHEPLLWLSPALIDLHALGLQTIGWLDPILVSWLERQDRLPRCWTAWQSV